MKYILTVCLLLFALGVFCQNGIRGTVTNPKGEALPFVNIQINANSQQGTTTDIDGRFVIATGIEIEQLIFSYVGYETLRVPVESGTVNLEIELKQSALDIDPIEIVAGENPAHRIIRRAVQMRDRNNPEKMSSYRCRTYNKMLFDFLPDSEAIAKQKNKIEEREASGKKFFNKTRKTQQEKLSKMQAAAERQHLFIMESSTRRSFRAPKDVNEVVEYNRVSGFSEPSFAALASAIQPFSFYQDHLEILDKDYLNPISPGSTKAYYFVLKDTLYHGRDSTFVLSFRPRKGKNFDGLKGLLYIHTSTYAIQNVIAQPADPVFIDLKIEQQYQYVDEKQWFPKALNFELIAKKYPHKLLGIQVSGRSYIDEVEINPDLKDQKFRKEAWDIADQAFEKSDSLWQGLRQVSLTEKEKRTYQVVDSIGAKKKFDVFLKATEALVSGHYPLGKVDFLLHHVLSFNQYENVRLGGGLSTNTSLSEFFTLEAYGGYGFKDKDWKYGTALHLHLLDEDRLNLSVSYSKDLMEPAVLVREPNELFSERFYASRMSQVEERRVALSSVTWSYLQTEVALSRSSWKPGFDYKYLNENVLLSTFDFMELAVNARYAFGEQTVNVLGASAARATSYPVLSMSYVRGIKNLPKGAFDFHRLSMALDHSFLIRRFGNSTYRLEAGFTTSDVPYNRLFVSNTFSNDSWLELLMNTFQTMEPYEFLSDRFVHFFFRHDFKSLLFRSKRIQPRIALIHNMGYGSLERAELHGELAVKTMEQGYFESGLRVGDILRIPYLNIAYIGLGAGVYHRYGPYALDGFWENTTVNLTVDFSF